MRLCRLVGEWDTVLPFAGGEWRRRNDGLVDDLVFGRRWSSSRFLLLVAGTTFVADSVFVILRRPREKRLSLRSSSVVVGGKFDDDGGDAGGGDEGEDDVVVAGEFEEEHGGGEGCFDEGGEDGGGADGGVDGGRGDVADELADDLAVGAAGRGAEKQGRREEAADEARRARRGRGRDFEEDVPQQRRDGRRVSVGEDRVERGVAVEEHLRARDADGAAQQARARGAQRDGHVLPQPSRRLFRAFERRGLEPRQGAQPQIKRQLREAGRTAGRVLHDLQATEHDVPRDQSPHRRRQRHRRNRRPRQWLFPLGW
mmetsp:Transcript_6866/g.21281  ORF Transcript_6866/g.21281 Transcript_6866/m.21281 type:complete len:313 (-) Transcript_6866:478-1416(-)